MQSFQKMSEKTLQITSSVVSLGLSPVKRIICLSWNVFPFSFSAANAKSNSVFIFVTRRRSWLHKKQQNCKERNKKKCSPPAQGQEGDPPACKTKFVFSKLKNVEANHFLCKLISKAPFPQICLFQMSFFYLMLSTRTERTCLPGKQVFCWVLSKCLNVDF